MTSRAGSYREYLRLDALLSLQQPVTADTDRGTWAGEHFFIVCHQISELCARQLFADLDCAALAARADDWPTARTCVQRGAALVRLTYWQLTTLLYLPVPDFRRFRDALMGASGAESEQFTELLRVARHPAVRSIDGALAAALPPDGAHPAGACSHETCATASALRSLIAGAALWRRGHARIARHFIGSLPGTGGTAGVSYLLRADKEPSVKPMSSAISSRR